MMLTGTHSTRLDRSVSLAPLFCNSGDLVGFSDPKTFILLRYLYAGQEATVRATQGTMDWFQFGKGVHQGCILSPYFFNLYAEYIMRNAGLEEA